MPVRRHWCEHCRDRFDVDHYDDLVVPEDDDSPCTGGGHKAGVEYGWFGRLLAVEQAAKDLAAAVAPLLDREVVSPFITAWEIDGFGTADGEDMHAALTEAHGKLAALLDDDPANT